MNYPTIDHITLLTGAAIFCARIIDVSLGTMRTIAIVQGRTRTAFVLGFFEVAVWITVISAVVSKIAENPTLTVFYALGFSTGNVVGIRLERRLAFGHAVLRVISPQNGERMAGAIRSCGCAVTTFQGWGRSGPVTELYVACRRKDLDEMIAAVRRIEPEAFYITELAGDVSKVCRYAAPEPTGWRAVLKRR
jgi:uncharacterized protein YebE (UPF0316 family)